ncbi:MAG TPA: hypothetical protein PLQ71_03190 [Nitrospira sp.]|nr:hypothetical protein [Nitrospira sp.]
MTQKLATRGGQYPITAEFTFDVANNTMKNTSGVDDNFKVVGSHVFDAILLPTNAIVVGGEVVTETAVSGSTAYNVSVGDSGSATRYLGATDKVAAGRTALVPTGFVGGGEQIRVTVAPTVADATAGKITVRVGYIIRNRVNEVQTH